MADTRCCGYLLWLSRDWSDSYLKRHSVENTRLVYPDVMFFREWAEANKDALIKAMSS